MLPSTDNLSIHHHIIAEKINSIKYAIRFVDQLFIHYLSMNFKNFINFLKIVNHFFFQNLYLGHFIHFYLWLTFLVNIF
jgi:hypothetical protein